MSLLDFDGDEDWDRHLARIQRRRLIANVLTFLFSTAGFAAAAVLIFKS